MIEPGRYLCDRCGKEIIEGPSKSTLDMKAWNELFDIFGDKGPKQKMIEKLINYPDLCPECKEKWHKLIRHQVAERKIFMHIKEEKNGA